MHTVSLVLKHWVNCSFHFCYVAWSRWDICKVYSLFLIAPQRPGCNPVQHTRGFFLAPRTLTIVLCIPAAGRTFLCWAWTGLKPWWAEAQLHTWTTPSISTSLFLVKETSLEGEALAQGRADGWRSDALTLPGAPFHTAFPLQPLWEIALCLESTASKALSPELDFSSSTLSRCILGKGVKSLCVGPSTHKMEHYM